MLVKSAAKGLLKALKGLLKALKKCSLLLADAVEPSRGPEGNGKRNYNLIPTLVVNKIWLNQGEKVSASTTFTHAPYPATSTGSTRAN